jgi:hypothetical protein
MSLVVTSVAASPWQGSGITASIGEIEARCFSETAMLLSGPLEACKREDSAI